MFSCSLVCFYSSWCRTVKYICGIPNYERDAVYIDFSANCRLPILKVPPEMLLFYALLTLWLLFLRADSLLEYLHWWHSLRYVFSGERFFSVRHQRVQCTMQVGQRVCKGSSTDYWCQTPGKPLTKSSQVFPLIMRVWKDRREIWRYVEEWYHVSWYANRD